MMRVRGVSGTNYTPRARNSARSAVVFQAETKDLLARFTTPQTAARKALINTLIKSLKSAGVWPKLDALYVMAAADSQAATRNWIADQYNLTAIGSPVFTADRCYAGDAVGAYLDTGLNPSTFGGKYVLNDACLFSWDYTNTGATTVSVGSSSAVSTCYIIPRVAINVILARINDVDASNIGSGITDSRGMTIINRTAAGARSIRKNLASVLVDTVSSTSITSANVNLLRRGITYSGRSLSQAGIGSALNDTQSDALYNALLAYNTAVGIS